MSYLGRPTTLEAAIREIEAYEEEYCRWASHGCGGHPVQVQILADIVPSRRANELVRELTIELSSCKRFSEYAGGEPHVAIHPHDKRAMDAIEKICGPRR